MASKVIQENEISLNSVYYKIGTPVRRFIASQFPGKITLGDYNLESNPITSTFVSSDHRGGLGIDRMDPSKDLDRVWWSTSQLRFKDHLVLPQLATASGSDPNIDLTEFLTFNGALYAAGGGFLHSYGTADTWTTTETSMQTSTDSGVGMVNSLPTAVFASENGVAYSTSGVSWATNTTSEAPYIAFWNNLIWAIDSDGQLKYSSDLSGSWTNEALLKMQKGEAVVGLIVARNASQERVLYVVTQQGLYVHDDTNSRLIETDFKIPFQVDNGKKTIAWRGSIYYPSKMGIYKITVGSDSTVISTIGLDKEDGVPSSYRGKITKLIPTHNELLAVVDATEQGTETTTKIHVSTGSSSRKNIVSFGGKTGYSYIAGFDERGWEIKHITGSSSRGITGAFTGTDQGNYRLWANYDDNAYYIDESPDVTNPSQISTLKYASSSTFETPYFDAGVVAQNKVALALRVETNNPTSSETVTVSYATNYSTTFTALDAITSSGETEIKLPSSTTPTGVEFRSIRFKVALARGGTNTNTPDMIKLALLFKKTLPVQYGFDVMIDLSESYKGKSVMDLQAAIETAISTNTLMEFTYRDDSGGTRNYYVTILSAQALEETGLNENARFRLTLSEAI